MERLESRLLDAVQQRIERLPQYERGQFEQWQQLNWKWQAQHEIEPGGAYAAYLDGSEPPRLPRHIERQLSDIPEITIDSSEADAAEAWRRAIAWRRAMECR